MNDLVSVLEIAILSFFFITVWSMNEYCHMLGKDHDKMMGKIVEFQIEINNLRKELETLKAVKHE